MISSLVQDKKTFEELKQYFAVYISNYTMDKIRANQEISGMHDAITIIEKAFRQMEIDYSVKKEHKKVDHTV